MKERKQDGKKEEERMFCSQDIHIIDCREGGMDFVCLGKAVRAATYCDITKAWVSHQQQWNQPLEWFCHRSRTWIQPSERGGRRNASPVPLWFLCPFGREDADAMTVAGAGGSGRLFEA